MRDLRPDGGIWDRGCAHKGGQQCTCELMRPSPAAFIAYGDDCEWFDRILEWIFGLPALADCPYYEDED